MYFPVSRLLSFVYFIPRRLDSAFAWSGSEIIFVGTFTSCIVKSKVLIPDSPVMWIGFLITCVTSKFSRTGVSSLKTAVGRTHDLSIASEAFTPFTSSSPELYIIFFEKSVKPGWVKALVQILGSRDRG